ncbi:MAG: hypothetical protein HYV28_10255 [Ignavibacteriales bacterium]|nr:hypothetical protein [Ignavibacteriales bacterium]
MIKDLRQKYNAWFTESGHSDFLKSINSMLPHPVDFRISETPLFLSDDLRDQLIDASYDVVNQLTTQEFSRHAQSAIPGGLSTPHRDEHPLFLQVDFAIAEGTDGGLIPQLIELQGFPSLYGFQYYFSEKVQEYFTPAATMTPFFSGVSAAEYCSLLRKMILGSHSPEEVILLEIEPERQKTLIDFDATSAITGINTVCVTKVLKENKDLFYINNSGEKIQIKRIYNRTILDELQRKPVPMQFSFHEELNVEWAGHPDWYFLISKHTLPFLKGKYVSDCFFLNDLQTYPEDLENFVLKPLYSFAGLGVEVDITRDRLDAIAQRENYILQRKITYAPLIKTPDGFSKAEIRMMFLWDEKPLLVNNLVRQSKGKMMGVDFNKNKTWVGSSCAFHSLPSLGLE